MNVRNYISFECAINALAQISKRIECDLSVHVAIDLAGRITKASKDVKREDVGVVIRQDREFFSVCTRENEQVYMEKDMKVIYPWNPAVRVDDKIILALAEAYNVGKPEGIFTKDNISRVECERGYFVLNNETIIVSEVKIKP
jgi:hypothetical protein